MRIKEFFRKVSTALSLLRELFEKYRDNKFSNAFLRTLLNNANSGYLPNEIHFVELGSENPGNCIGVIQFPKEWIVTAGFFALFHRMLCGLHFADRVGLIPVVDAWTGCPYEEDIPINGTRNVFEYYFEPLSAISMESALNSQAVVKILNPNMDLVLHEYGCEWFDMSDKYIEEMGRLFKKYIRLNPKTKTLMQKDIEKVLRGKRTLGVHFRGTDYTVGAIGHPVALQVEDYFEEIDNAIEKYGFEQIFIATDDLSALGKFKAKYKKLVYYRDVLRAKGNVSVAFLQRDGVKTPHFRSGYEVLRDAYTLGQCDGLISGKSQVSTNARINKASQEKHYEYSKTLSRGIHRTGVDWVKEFDQFVK